MDAIVTDQQDRLAMQAVLIADYRKQAAAAAGERSFRDRPPGAPTPFRVIAPDRPMPPVKAVQRPDSAPLPPPRPKGGKKP